MCYFCFTLFTGIHTARPLPLIKLLRILIWRHMHQWAHIRPIWFSFYRRIPLPRSRIWTKGRTQQNPIPEIRCQNLNQKRKQPRTCFPKSDSAAGQNLKKLYQLVCQMTYIFFTSDFPQLFFHSRFFTAAFRKPQPNQTEPKWTNKKSGSAQAYPAYLRSACIQETIIQSTKYIRESKC